MPKASRRTASEKVELEGYEGQVEHWHTPTLLAGSEIVEFHPTNALVQTMDVVTRNMEAARAHRPGATL